MPLKKKLKSKLDGTDEPDNVDLDEIEDDDNSDSSSTSGDQDFEDDEDQDEVDDDGEMLMVDFEAREPQGADMESIKTMLKQKFGESPVNVDELARIIVEQGNNMGNVVFQAVDEEDEEPVATATTSSDESDIFGVLSGVDLSSPRTKSFSSGFVKYISKKDDINQILESKKVFYVVNERFINMPVKISIPMFQDLLKSLQTEKLEFDYWLFVAKVYHQPPSRDNPERMYVNPEEEVFEEFSECKLELNDSKANGATTNGVRASFSVYLVPASKIDDALSKIINLSQ